MPRPFTENEIAEVRRLVVKCFTGKGDAADMDRCNELWRLSPKEYCQLADAARDAERKRLRSF